MMNNSLSELNPTLSNPLIQLSQLQLPLQLELPLPLSLHELGFDPDPIQFPRMSQCVPNWDLVDDDPTQPHLSFLVATPTPLGPGPGLDTVPVPNLSPSDYEVAELTWDNGQLSLHGFGSRLNSRPASTVGTLESLVDQATSVVNNVIPAAGGKPSFPCAADRVPWFNPPQAPTGVVGTTSTTATVTMDVAVPCVAAIDNPHRQAEWLLGESVGHGTGVYGCCSTRVGSCSEIGGGKGVINPAEEQQRQDSRRQTCCGGVEWEDHQSASGSATNSYNVTTQDTYGCEPELENPASQRPPEDMSRGKGDEGGRTTAAATTEEHDSIYSGPQREAEEKRRLGKSSASTKCSRAAAIHNQSERKRRDKINQRMKTLQKLVPNSSKTDKASVLDEVIDYLKQLQVQVQVMSRMNVPTPSMMLPLTMQQQFQFSMMAPMGVGLGLAGMPGVMPGDISGLGGNRPKIPGVPPVLHPFMPTAPWDGTPRDRFPSGPATEVMPDPLSTFLASQSSPAMTVDAYSRLVAMYQHHMRQHQQQQPSNPIN